MHKKLVLTLFLAGLFSESVFGTNLISRSSILISERTRIVPLKVSEAGEVLIKATEKVGKSLLVLNSDGKLVVVKRVYSKKKHQVPWGCGGPVDAKAFKAINGEKISARFAFTGDLRNRVKVRWTPAKKVKLEKPPKCIAYKRSHRLKDVKGSKLAFFSGNFFYAHWEHLQPNADPKKCAKDEHFQRLGYLMPDKGCVSLFENPIDCDGRGYGGGVVGDLVGGLELRKGRKGEQWLIFQAWGYEGKGFLSFRVNPKTLATDSNPDFVVYSGC